MNREPALICTKTASGTVAVNAIGCVCHRQPKLPATVCGHHTRLRERLRKLNMLNLCTGCLICHKFT